MAHEICKEMLAIHALSALDTSDQREVQTHLDDCRICRADFEIWQATAAALAYVTPPLEPSPQVRQRILERVRRDESTERPAEQSRVLDFAPPARRTRSYWPVFAAIAASIIFVALSVALVALWRQNRNANGELARLSQQLHLAEQKFARENQLVQILTTPGAHSELDGTKDAPNAHAVLAVDRESGRAVLAARGLPLAPSGKAYQLWFIASGKPPAPGKVFTPDASGNAVLEDQLPASAINATVFAVTLEPQAGVLAPTGSMYLLSPAKDRSPS
jgi:anti-sigma-K factor RskA